jgi:hypothetical protein
MGFKYVVFFIKKEREREREREKCGLVRWKLKEKSKEIDGE